MTQMRALVSENGPLAGALDRFRLDVGDYPRDLIELSQAPVDDMDAVSSWCGPYVRNPDDMKDPWGNLLHYRFPGQRHPDSYDLWSVGPDGESGTEDDITN